MGDIFDEVAGGTATIDAGDIFDQVAAQSPTTQPDIFDQVAAQSAPQQPDIFDHVASAGNMVPTPAPSASAESDLFGGGGQRPINPTAPPSFGEMAAGVGSEAVAGANLLGRSAVSTATNLGSMANNALLPLNPFLSEQDRANLAGLDKDVRDINAEKTAQASEAVQTEPVRFIAGSAVPMAATIGAGMVGGPPASALVGGAVTTADTIDAVERRTGSREQATKVGALTAIPAALSAGFVGAGNTIPKQIAADMAVGGAQDVAQQGADYAVTGQPIDPMQTVKSVGAAGVVSGAMRGAGALLRPGQPEPADFTNGQKIPQARPEISQTGEKFQSAPDSAAPIDLLAGIEPLPAQVPQQQHDPAMLRDIFDTVQENMEVRNAPVDLLAGKDSLSPSEPAGTPSPAPASIETPGSKQPWETTLEDLESRYKPAGKTVDGRIVRKDTPNESSIRSSVDNPTILPGIYEVPMSDFTLTGKHYSVSGSKRIDELAGEIAASKEINPLIVVIDAEGPYILEGATRAESLHKLGAKSFPAKVVIDEDSFYGATKKAHESSHPVPPEVLADYPDLRPPEGTAPLASESPSIGLAGPKTPEQPAGKEGVHRDPRTDDELLEFLARTKGMEFNLPKPSQAMKMRQLRSLQEKGLVRYLSDSGHDPDANRGWSLTEAGKLHVAKSQPGPAGRVPAITDADLPARPLRTGDTPELDEPPRISREEMAGLMGDDEVAPQAPLKIGDRVTLPDYTGAPGEGVNYGTVHDAEIVRASPKFVTVRTSGDGAREIRIPRAVAESATAKSSLAAKEVLKPAVGLGPAHANDPAFTAKDPGAPTGIKNATQEIERALHGIPTRDLPDPVTFGEAKDMAAKMLVDNPNAGAELVDALKKDPARPLRMEEDMLLAHRQVELDKQLTLAGDQIIEAHNKGDPALHEAAQARWSTLNDQYRDVMDVSSRGGTATARGLSFRRAMVNQDFTLAAMERRKSVAKGGEPLTESERQTIREQHQKIIDTQKAFDDYVAKATEKQSDLEASNAILRIVREVKSDAKPPPNKNIVLKFLSDRATEARARIAERGMRLKAGIDPIELADYAIIGAEHLGKGVAKFAEWSKVMIADMGEAIRPHLPRIFAKAQEAHTELTARAGDFETTTRAKGERKTAAESIKEKIAEGGELKDMTTDVQKLARKFVGEGVTDREKLIDAVHVELKNFLPEITRRQTMDAISGYGDFKQLSKDQISVKLRDLKGQMQNIAKLDDLFNKQMAMKTGVERRTPSDMERRLIKMVNEAKSKLGIKTTDPATQLKSALDARKTYIRNRMADLREEIRTRQQIIKDRGSSPVDEQLKAMQAEYAVIKDEHEKVFGKKEMSDEQRVKLAIGGAERAEMEWNKRLENAKKGIFPGGKELSKTPKSEQLDAIRKRTEAVRAQVQELKDLAYPKKTPDQIALQAFKTRTLNRIAELAEKHIRGDYTTRTRRAMELDTEGVRLKAENERWKRLYQRGLERDKWKNRTTGQKALDASKEILNLPKAIKSAYDLSAPFRQGAVFTLGHPLKTATHMKRMVLAGASESYAQRLDVELRSREMAPLGERGKLELTRLGDEVGPHEEAIRSRYSDKIPGIKQSNRAFTSFLNQQRAAIFDSMVRSMQTTPTTADLRAIAHAVNVGSGRGHWNRFEPAMSGLSHVLWSPKLLLSRFQLLTGQPVLNATPATRKIIAKELVVRPLVGLAGVYALSMMAGATVGTDRKSTDFGKIKVGNTTIDPLAGLNQIMVMLSRLQSGEKTTAGGKTVPIRGDKVPYGGDTGWDVMSNFARTKLSPTIGTPIDLISGKNVIGEPVTPTSAALPAITPLAWQDIYDAINEQGLPRGTALGLLGFLGAGVNTRTPKPPKPVEPPKKPARSSR